MHILTLIFGFILLLLMPCLILGLWRKRPILSFMLAAIVLFLTLIAPDIIKAYQAMMIDGEGDPQRIAGEISEGIVSALLGMIILLPLLALFQWFVRRHYNKKFKSVDAGTTFS